MKKYTTIDPDKLAAARDLLRKNSPQPQSLAESKLLDTILKDESQSTNSAVAGISILAGYFSPRCMSKVVAQTMAAIAEEKIKASTLKLIPMSPTEYSDDGAKLIINYNYAPTAFGQILIASTDKGVCYATFIDDDNKLKAIEKLKQLFPQARYKKYTDEFQRRALFAFKGNHNIDICLHLKGTSFQLAVWNNLLKVPPGGLITYSLLMGDKKKSRATGTAIANNPVAYLVPCHRVIRSTGTFNQYRWGSSRKTALLAWEAARTNNNKNNHCLLA